VKEAPPAIVAIPGGFFGLRNPSGIFGAEWVGHGKRALWWELWGYSILL